MAASTITRTTWTNDTGTPASPVGDGTLINNARLQDIYAAIDQLFSGAGSYTTLTLGGLLKVEGFGAHDFSAGGATNNSLRVRNTTSATGAFASLDLGNNSTATLTRVISFSSGYTSAGYLQASGSLFEANGAGGLSIAATDAAGNMRFYTGSGITERMRITAAGLIGMGIGVATPASDLELRATADGLSGGMRITRADGSYFILNMDDGGATAWATLQAGDGGAFRPIRINPNGGQAHFADGSAAAPAISFVSDTDTGIYRTGSNAIGVAVGGALQYEFSAAASLRSFSINSSANGTGAVQGNRLIVGRNSSGSGAAGGLSITNRPGTDHFFWPDASGNLRVTTGTPPTEDNTTSSDTSGTVVGTQTSTRATKRLIRRVKDVGASLRLLAETPLYRFNYRRQDRATRFLGIMADESPEFVMHGGQSFNPVNAFGHTAAAVKALLARVESLEAALAARG